MKSLATLTFLMIRNRKWTLVFGPPRAIAKMDRERQGPLLWTSHGVRYSSNLLIDVGMPTRIHQIWLGDITYIPLEGRVFRYMALLMDLYSRWIIG